MKIQQESIIKWKKTKSGRKSGASGPANVITSPLRRKQFESMTFAGPEAPLSGRS